VLLEGEGERQRFAVFAIDVTVRGVDGVMRCERVLPYRRGRCAFLGEDDRCTIYEDRPVNCQRFQCVSGYHLGGGDLSRHSEFLERNADVLDRLEGM
jgi:Fe-S-cluster containining protein